VRGGGGEKVLADSSAMDTVEITINGQKVQVPSGATILEAARSAGIYIPRFVVILICRRRRYSGIGLIWGRLQLRTLRRNREGMWPASK
jgi:hypothetical protein